MSPGLSSSTGLDVVLTDEAIQPEQASEGDVMSTSDDCLALGPVAQSLGEQLVGVLGVLDGAPPGMAEATIALLPYGSRVNLVGHGLIEPMHGGAGNAVEIQITEQGWETIHACAGLRHRRSKPQEHVDQGIVPALRNFVDSLQTQRPTVNLGHLSSRLRRDG